MHDIKAIRENPEIFDAAWARRGLEPQSKTILEKDILIRQALKVQQEAEQARNKASKQIGAAMGKGDKEEAERLKTEVAGAKNVIAAMAVQIESEKAVFNDLLAGLPNLPFDSVPDGEGEEQNVVLRKEGTPTTFDFKPKAHDDLGEALGMMDFETAAKMSGSRFVVLSGKLSRLDRALAAFMLDIQTEEHGYTETTPPFLVKAPALYGTGQLPKFEEDLYKTGGDAKAFADALNWAGDDYCLTTDVVDDYHQVIIDSHDKAKENGINVDDFEPVMQYAEKVLKVTLQAHKNFQKARDEANEEALKASSDLYLIPTSEVSLTNIVRDSIIDEASLPRRYTAHTPCFRSEAGSAGRDTKGMIRQHQFNKVELVSITKPEDSEAEHERMLGCAEEILKRLDLPYRVVELCTGDLGFGARRTYDLEVWLPSQDTYREISSVSNCGDFQARRMNARYKAGEKDNRFVHTLNGSGLAVGRTLVAVLENNQNEDGSINIPAALVPYMGGLTKLEK